MRLFKKNDHKPSLIRSLPFRPSGSIKALAQDPAEDKAKKFERTPIQAPTVQEPGKPKEPEAEEKYAWGTNMLLVGDTFWCSFKRLAGLAYYLLDSFFFLTLCLVKYC